MAVTGRDQVGDGIVGGSTDRTDSRRRMSTKRNKQTNDTT